MMRKWIHFPYVVVGTGCRFMGMCVSTLVVLHKIVSICDARWIQLPYVLVYE